VKNVIGIMIDVMLATVSDKCKNYFQYSAFQVPRDSTT